VNFNRESKPASTLIYQPHPLYPPLHSWRGGIVFLEEGLTPLLNTPLDYLPPLPPIKSEKRSNLYRAGGWDAKRTLEIRPETSPFPPTQTRNKFLTCPSEY